MSLMEEREIKKRLPAELHARFDDLLSNVADEYSDRGFNEAVREIANGTFTHPALEDIQARYEYLRKSGQWQRDTTGDLYVRGFEDAMKVLGLLPMVGP